MAFAIMGGLMIGTLLMLVFLPTLYVTVFGGRADAPLPAKPAVVAPGVTGGGGNLRRQKYD